MWILSAWMTILAVRLKNRKDETLLTMQCLPKDNMLSLQGRKILEIGQHCIWHHPPIQLFQQYWNTYDYFHTWTVTLNMKLRHFKIASRNLKNFKICLKWRISIIELSLSRWCFWNKNHHSVPCQSTRIEISGIFFWWSPMFLIRVSKLTCKEQDSTLFMFCGTYCHCCNYSTLLL